MSDEILRKALRISMERELETMLPDDNSSELHSFSPEFEKNMGTIIKKAKIKYINIRRFRIRKSIVAASLMVFIYAASMSVEAFRIPLIRLSEKVYTQFSAILFENEENIETPTRIKDLYVPAYIPEGYTLKEESEDFVSMHYFMYTNEKDQFIFVEQYTLGVSMSVDTEGTTTERIMIKGMEGIIYSKNGLTTVIVNDDNYVHMVSGYVSREDIIKITESLYIKK
jgi:hypothetical protein